MPPAGKNKTYGHDRKSIRTTRPDGRIHALEGEIKCSDLNPKATLLLAAAKCSGLTTMRIMEKERVRPKRFEISVSGALSTETLQSGSIFTSFNICLLYTSPSPRDTR